MYAGYNHQLAIKAELLNTGTDSDAKATRAEEFSDMVNAFIYFNNILRKRIKTKTEYMRMTETMFQERPSADKKRRTIEFCSETEQFIAELAKGVVSLTGDAKLASLTQTIIVQGGATINDQQEEDFRDALTRNIRALQEQKPDELAKLAQMASRGLKGISGAQLTAAEMEKAKAA